MALNIELDMTVESGRDVNMSVDPIDEVSFGVGEAVVVRDHAILTNRDLPDQHPISAITGLTEALAQSGKIDTVKQNGVALPVVDKAVNVTVPTKTSDLTNDSGFAVDSNVVHKTGEETITGKKIFTNSAEISRTTSGPILKLSSNASDTNFILERTGGSQCVLESGASLGLFGTKTNHPLQVRTNYVNRMTIGTDGSVVVATDVPSNSNNNQVATTKWVNAKGYATTSQLPTKTSDLTNDSGFINGINSSDVISALGYTPGTYSKPNGGIPKSDLSSAVQSSLGLADSSIQVINYDFGAVTLDNNRMFQITQEQYNAVKELWDSNELCSVSCTVDGISFYCIKQHMESLNNVPFMGFVGTTLYNSSPAMVMIGVSQYLVAGIVWQYIPSADDVTYEINNTVNSAFDNYKYSEEPLPVVSITQSSNIYTVNTLASILYDYATYRRGAVGLCEYNTSITREKRLFFLVRATKALYQDRDYMFIWISAGYDGIGTYSYDVLVTNASRYGDNPSGSITSYTPPTLLSELTNDVGYITGITSTDVTNALGYTPANSSDLSDYLNKTTGGTVNANVTFKKSTDAPTSPLIRFQSIVDNTDSIWAVDNNNGSLVFFWGNSNVAEKVRFDSDGSITAKTQTAGDNSTKVATTAFVKSVLPTIPTNVSAFTNDAGYLVANDFVEVTDAQIHAIVV